MCISSIFNYFFGCCFRSLRYIDRSFIWCVSDFLIKALISMSNPLNTAFAVHSNFWYVALPHSFISRILFSFWFLPWHTVYLHVFKSFLHCCLTASSDCGQERLMLWLRCLCLLRLAYVLGHSPAQATGAPTLLLLSVLYPAFHSFILKKTRDSIKKWAR